MSLLPAPSRYTLIALALCVSSLVGCASVGLPRIDPSGERILIFPGETPPAAPPAAFGQQPAFTTPPPAAVDPFTVVAPITPPPGNPTAPPVLAQNSPGLLGGLFGGPTIIGPAVGPPQVGQPIAVAGQPQDRLTLTPERVLAPIGSEVVLRAGICGASGYLITNRRIEWGLEQQGVGRFVTIGDRGQPDVLRLPWQRPNLVDGAYAIGYTTPFHTCLRRNAADPADDIQIQPGDAWISITSPTEGASYVTAFAPSIEDWAARKASTVIYWVDAQWALPPSATVEVGQPHTLTTTITRQSDGTPLAGWIVRYEVADPSRARLGYEAGQSTEATTDGQGRASIVVNPTDSTPGSTTVNVTIVRPDRSATGGGPRIDVGTGAATITWGSGVPTVPTTPGDALPPIAPAPTTPDPPTFEPPIGIEAPPRPAGAPDLVVDLRRETPDPIRVGDTVAYTVMVRNAGTAPARRIVITDEFDQGLSNQYDTDGRNRVVYDQMSDLGPNESDSVRLEFQVVDSGPRRNMVTVTADGATETFDRDTFEAVPLTPPTPELTLRMEADRRRTEGDLTTFAGVVENTGDTPATNVVVRMRFDRALSPTDAQQAVGDDRFSDLGDSFEWIISRIEPGQRRPFGLRCRCDRPSRSACVVMTATADGGANEAIERCVEILPAVGESPAEGGAGPPAGAATNLQLSIASDVNPARLNTRRIIRVFVRNAGATAEQQVIVQVRLPDQVRPDMRLIQPANSAQVLEGGVLQFAPIANLPPGEQEVILIPFDAIGQGLVPLEARVLSDATPNGITAEQSLEILPQ